MKRDRDNTDFRAVRDSYNLRVADCPFCTVEDERIIGRSELAYAIYDAYPVIALHTLIIPKRHVETYFELARPEVNACNQLLQEAKRQIEEIDERVSGFNIGINSGETAGQTWVIVASPDTGRRGDVDDPRGGVRHVIPGKGSY
jgi:hypothetical protein